MQDAKRDIQASGPDRSPQKLNNNINNSKFTWNFFYKSTKANTALWLFFQNLYNIDIKLSINNDMILETALQTTVKKWRIFSCWNDISVLLENTLRPFSLRRFDNVSFTVVSLMSWTLSVRYCFSISVSVISSFIQKTITVVWRGDIRFVPFFLLISGDSCRFRAWVIATLMVQCGLILQSKWWVLPCSPSLSCMYVVITMELNEPVNNKEKYFFYVNECSYIWGRNGQIFKSS